MLSGAGMAHCVGGHPRLGFRELQAQKGHQRVCGGACPTPGSLKAVREPGGVERGRSWNPLERLSEAEAECRLPT